MIILLSQIKIAVSGLELQISPVQIFIYNIKGYNIYIIIYILVVDWGGGCMITKMFFMLKNLSNSGIQVAHINIFYLWLYGIKYIGKGPLQQETHSCHYMSYSFQLAAPPQICL